MGKSKSKSKLSSLRSNPLLSTKSIDSNPIKDELLGEIMEKLLSGKPSDRHLGAELVSNSLSSFDDYKTEDLVRLIRTLSPLCCDRAENVRFATIDALCYLSSLSDKMCDILIESDVMTSVITLMSTFIDNDWVKSMKNKMSANIYIDSSRLLTNLCGSSSKALEIFNNNPNLSQVLIKGLKSFQEEIEVSIASAQCLSIVVDENTAPEVVKQENIDIIKSLLLSLNQSPSHLHLSNLVAFIVNNIIENSDTEAFDTIFNVINQTLGVEVLQNLNTFSVNLNEYVNDDKQTETLNKSYEELKNLLLAKRVALELFTNIIGFEDIENADDLMDCDMNSDDEECLENGCVDENETTIPPEFEEKIISKSIFTKIVSHLSSLESEMIEIFSRHIYGREILKCIESIQECSLASIHNLVLNMSKEKLIINDIIWDSIINLVFNTINLNLLEQSTNTMRAIITKYSEIALNDNQLEKLCIICQNSKLSNAIKINVIKIMSVLAERSADLVFIEKISKLLLTAIENESDLVIRAELFDAIIDIFSEDYKTDEIANKINLINNIKSHALRFKKQASKSGQLSKQNPVISTVKLNLMNFIRYKEKTLSKS